MQLATNNLKSLIQKYGIILIIFFLLNQFIHLGLVGWLTEVLYANEIGGRMLSSRANAILFSLVSIALNSIIAIVTLSDSKKIQLRWLIFFVTLLAPAIGVVFLLLVRVIEKDDTE